MALSCTKAARYNKQWTNKFASNNALNQHNFHFICRWIVQTSWFHKISRIFSNVFLYSVVFEMLNIYSKLSSTKISYKTHQIQIFSTAIFGPSTLRQRCRFIFGTKLNAFRSIMRIRSQTLDRLKKVIYEKKSIYIEIFFGIIIIPSLLHTNPLNIFLFDVIYDIANYYNLSFDTKTKLKCP